MYLDIIYDGYRYAQRSEMSVIKEYDLDGNLVKVHNITPFYLKKEIETAKDMIWYPERYFEYREEYGEIEITAYKCKNNKKIKNIKIPRCIDNKLVTSLAECAFSSDNSVEYVDIPDTVENIGKSCFEDCRYLKKVNLPKKIQDIPDECFRGTLSLYDINLDNIVAIGKSAFCRTGLRQINLPHCVKIEDEAFSISDLVSANIENACKVGASVFANDNQLKELILSEYLERIPNYLCYNCLSLEEIQIPENTIRICEGAFKCCGLKEIKLPDQLEIIDKYAFYFCEFEKLDLPNDLKLIGEHAFSQCKNLKRIIMSPDTQYDSNAFDYAQKLLIKFYQKEQEKGLSR